MKRNDFVNLLEDTGMNQKKLEKIAFDSGFIVRKRLITASDLLYSFCMETADGIASYNDIAAHIDSKCGVSVSRQAIWKKATDPCLTYFKTILEHLILSKTKNMDIVRLKYRSSYKRILVQDSTIIKLPPRLFEMFSGVSNGFSKVCNARIQGIYDILNEKFIKFSIDPYSKNDLEAAPEIELKKGDLSLRDRGYLINDEIQRHFDTDAHCVYRHKFGTLILDEFTEEPINLLEKLKKENFIDMSIKLNNKRKTIARIVAQPVSDKIANERRRKAKQEKKLLPQKNIWNCFHGLYLLPLFLKKNPAMTIYSICIA